MARTFDCNSTTDDVLKGVDLRGRRAFITGVSAGLGLETARALVAHGAAVTGTVRDAEKARPVTQVVRDAAIESGGTFEIIAMDLADLASVRAVTGTLLARNEPLDMLIANAGVMATPFERTRDGFELQFATNVLGHQVLASRLEPLMREGARLIVLSSNGHRMSDMDLDDLNFERTPYDPWTAYGRSKTGDALLAVAFDARNRARGVRAASVHPGGTPTELSRHMDPVKFQAAFDAMHEQHLARGNPPYQPKTVPQGAATTVWAAVVADAGAIGGRYCEDCRVARTLPDDAEVSPLSPGVRRYALDTDRAAALWDKADELAGRCERLI